MEITTMVALAVAVPVVLFPAAFVLYLNIGGVVTAIRKAAEKKTAKAVA